VPSLERQSSLILLAAEQRQLIAWGERTEPWRAFVLPQDSDTINAFTPGGMFLLACPGAANCSLRRAILTPGYQLPLLRSSRIVLIN
jgi:hypothetical protein